MELTGKFGLRVQNKAGQRLTEFYQENAGHSKHPLPTPQEITLHMDITKWSIQNQTDYILCSQRWRSSIQSQKQEWELTVAQIMNSLLPNSDLS